MPSFQVSYARCFMMTSGQGVGYYAQLHWDAGVSVLKKYFHMTGCTARIRYVIFICQKKQQCVSEEIIFIVTGRVTEKEILFYF